MLPSNRSRFDTEAQAIEAFNSGLTTDHLPDLARQEFKNESDINTIIGRVGPDGLIHKQGAIYTETDFGLDLQSAMELVSEMKAAHRRLPRALREEYPTWVNLIAAIESGAFQRELLNQQPEPAPEPEPEPEPEPLIPG